MQTLSVQIFRVSVVLRSIDRAAARLPVVLRLFSSHSGKALELGSPQQYESAVKYGFSKSETPTDARNEVLREDLAEVKECDYRHDSKAAHAHTDP